MDDTYTVWIFSRDGDYPEFLGIDQKWTVTSTTQLKNGTLRIGRCVGVEYDTQIEVDGKPAAAFTADDPYYFLRTRLLVEVIK